VPVAGARLARAPAQAAGGVAARLDAAPLDRLVLPRDRLDLLLLRLLLGLFRLDLGLDFRLVQRALDDGLLAGDSGGSGRFGRLRLFHRLRFGRRRGLRVLLAALLLYVVRLPRRELGMLPRFRLAQRQLVFVEERLLHFGLGLGGIALDEHALLA